MMINVVVECPPWAKTCDIFFRDGGPHLKKITFKREFKVQQIEAGPWEEVKE